MVLDKVPNSIINRDEPLNDDQYIVEPHVQRNIKSAEFVTDFLQYLKQNNRLDNASTERAALVAKETGERIDLVICELGLLSVVDMTAILAQYLGLEVVQAHDLPEHQLLESELSTEFLRRNLMVVVSEDETKIVLAIANPHAFNELEAVKFITEREVLIKLASRNDIETTLRNYDDETEREEISGAEEAASNQEDIQRLKDTASEAPVIRHVNRLIETAVKQRASDIHIEPMVDGTRVRLRIDGRLREIERLPAAMQSGIVSRIKILAKLDIAERRLPQDGRTKFVSAGRKIDLRVSTMPVLFGESLVLRILDAGQVEMSFPMLGFTKDQQAVFSAILSKPNGIVLVTGPTGSGKTTTLYSALQTVNSSERKLFTVEDPIEYELAGVNQIQAASSIGLGFAEALRSILRQDPDIVMVGEMRDLETARIGIQAALTGHLVLSTLHTNSACASVVRMLDMGVQDYLLKSSLVAVVAQRLVRKLCHSCSKQSQENEKRLMSLGLNGFDYGAINVREPVGCEKCHNTGYSGRTTIAEFLLMDDELRQLVTSDTNSAELERCARAKGMKTLLESGVAKVLVGETSLEEVLMAANL